MYRRMTRRDELLALAVRVRREEPSRQLDLEIGRVARGWQVLEPHAEFAPRLVCPPDKTGWRSHLNGLPAYTTSLDAAVTLVPKCEWWEIYYEDGWQAGPAKAKVELSDVTIYGFGKTPALALCAAALRALAQEEKSQARSHLIRGKK